MTETVGGSSLLYWSIQMDGETKEVFKKEDADRVFNEWSQRYSDKEVHLVEIWGKITKINKPELNAGVTSISEDELEALKEKGRYQLREYSQYEGKFDHLYPVIVKKDIKTKLGFAFKKGEIVLLNPTSSDPTLYSFTNKCFTLVGPRDFKALKVVPVSAKHASKTETSYDEEAVTSISGEDLEELKAKARQHLSGYTKEKGLAENLIPVIMTKDIGGGEDFDKGEIALLDPRSADPTIFSMKRSAFTIVTPRDFKLLEVLPPPTLNIR